MITSLIRNYTQVRRFFEITKIVLKHLYWEWKSKRVSSKRRRNRPNAPQMIAVSTPERLRLTIEELGPTYIKFGQILADRPDIVAERFRMELKKLQSSAEPMSDREAIRLIEIELGDSIHEVFAEFDSHCLASASIGQVYQARLKTGEDVVVKIQRPFIENKIKLDLFLMRRLANFMVKDHPELAAINILGAVEEFGDSIMKELDYLNEASNMMRFHAMFADNDKVYIPKVYLEYTTKRIMVQERLRGISPDNRQRLIDEGYDLREVAENGANALLKMILGEGFFHADPHAGNMFILPGNVVGLIDFGMVGVLRPRDMNFLANFAVGFISQNTHAVTSALITLCGAKYFDQSEDLEFELQQLLKRYEHLPMESIDFSQVLQACFNLVIKYKLQIPGGIFMLGKSLATIQKVAQELSPDIALVPLIQPYAKEIVKRTFSPKRLATSVFETVQDYVSLFRSFPNQMSEILYKLKNGEIKHDIRLSDSDMVKNVVGRLSKRMAFSVVMVGVFIGSIMLLNNGDERGYGELLLFCSSVVLFFALIKWLFSKN